MGSCKHATLPCLMPGSFHIFDSVKRQNLRVSNTMMMNLVLRIVVLLILSQMLHRAVTAQQCKGGGSEHSILGWKLQRHTYRTMMAKLGHECLFACRRDDRCQSFNFVNSLGMCEFNDRTKEATPEDFVPDPDRYYYRRDIKRGKVMHSTR